jgi:hypothetical protein
MIMVGVVSAQSYYEASQKFGWTWTKTNRHLRVLNAYVPPVFKNGVVNTAFWSEMGANMDAAKKDTSYLVYPVASSETLYTLALQRTGMEEQQEC